MEEKAHADVQVSPTHSHSTSASHRNSTYRKACSFTPIMVFLLISLLILCIPLIPQKSEPRMTDFPSYEAQFSTVSEFLNQYYIGCNTNECIHVVFSDGKIILPNDIHNKEDDIIISDALSSDVAAFTNKNFYNAFIYEDYIIYWADETGKYGLLWAEHTWRGIAAFCKKHSDRDYAWISDHWFEVGILYHF